MNPRHLAALSAFKASGLKVQRFAIESAGDEGMLIAASGWHSDGRPFAYASQPFTGNPVVRAKQAAQDLIRAHTGQNVGKFSEIADRLKKVHVQLDSQGQRLADRLGELETKAAQVVARQDAVLAAREADLAALENEINQLSNE